MVGHTLGMRYCLMGTSNMMGMGKITPAGAAAPVICWVDRPQKHWQPVVEGLAHL